MRRRKKQILKVVNLLTDAEPRYASFVGNGANQTPFRKLAQDEDGNTVDVTETPGAEATAQEPNMAKTDTTGVRQRSRKAKDTSGMQPEIHKMVFPVAEYADEAAVKGYLINHGYEPNDLEITGKGLTWEVAGHPADSFSTEIQEIELENVTLHVGVLSEEAVAELEAKAAAKADEPAAEEGTPVQEAAKSGAVEETVTDVTPGDDRVEAAGDAAEEDRLFAEALGFALKTIEDGVPETVAKFDDMLEVVDWMDSVPPGFYDLMGAFDSVVRSGLRDKDYGRVRKAARDLGEFTIQLATIFETAEKSEKAEDHEAAHKAAQVYLAAVAKGITPDEQGSDEAEAEAVADAAKAAEDAAAAAAEADVQKTEDLTADGKPAGEVTDEPGAETPATPAAATKDEEAPDTDALASIIKAALAPMAEQLNGIEKRLDATEQTLSDEADGKAAPQEVVQPSRKGVDEQDEAVQKENEKSTSYKYADNLPDDKLFRDSLGI